MSTYNTITIFNETDKQMHLDTGHLHINHYDSPARSIVTHTFYTIAPHSSQSCTIHADSSSHPSTIEMSFFIFEGQQTETVRYYLRQAGKTKAEMNKNQTPFPAKARTVGANADFYLGD